MRRRICGRYILIGILGIVICLGLIPCRTTLAAGSLYDNANQDDYLLELSPVSRRMSFKPGEQKKENLQIKNTGRKAVYVDVYAEAYVPEDEIAGQNEGLADTYTQLSQWVKFKDDNGEYHHTLSFTLYPNQIRDVRYSVDVPKETVGGGQYAIIFAEFTPTKTDDESTFKARSRMGMSLFASVDDSGVVRDAQINNIKINGVLVNRNITIDYTVKNSGNIDFQSSNEMTVESIFGKELYHDIFVKTILPESSKAISDEWKEAPGFGLFRVKYRIIALNAVEEGERVIFVMPTGGLGLVVLLLIAAAIVVRYFRLKRARDCRARILGSKTY